MQQAVLLDIALIFPQLFQQLFGGLKVQFPQELVEPSASATPVGQSKWLHEHITAMRGAIEAQLTGVFSS